MEKIFFLLIIVFFASCQFDGKAQGNKGITADKKCNGYGGKYVSFFNQWSVNREDKIIIDSTLYFLDKLIQCDPEDKGLIQEKANFLIYNKFYERAIEEVDSISMEDPFFLMMKGTIALKLNQKKGEVILKDAHRKFIQKVIEYNEPTDVFHKIVLDNYFQGNEYALDEIVKYKQNSDDEYMIATFEVFEQMLKEKSEKEILYDLFKIE